MKNLFFSLFLFFFTISILSCSNKGTATLSKKDSIEIAKVIFTDSLKSLFPHLTPEKQKEIADMLGGPVTKQFAQNSALLFKSYLQLKEPVSAEFNKRYVAGSYYNMAELETYFNSIKNTSGLRAENIRVYVAPFVYPQGTTHTYSNGVSRNVEYRISSGLIFMSSPNSILNGGNIYIDGNPNCLGAYNWGDLEP